jgi:hypothetical protein
MSEHISEKLKGQIRELLEYPEQSIGRAMTTDFIALKKGIRHSHGNGDSAINKTENTAGRLVA